MQLLRFSSWMKKSLKEKRGSQNIDFSNWRGFREDVFPKEKTILMKQLTKKLQNKDWWGFMADSGVDRKRYEKEDEEIKDLMRTIGGDEPKKLFRKYGKKSGTLEGKNVFEWLQLIEIEEKKRTKKEKEEDDELVNVKPKIKESTEQYMNPENWFPETRGVNPTGSLNELIPLGAKRTSHMSDGGNLSFNQNQWTPPSVPKKSYLDKHYEQTSKFGKVDK